MSNLQKNLIPKKSKSATVRPIYPDILDYKPSVLLIEDDPIIQYIHKKMLADLGCEVSVASCGKEAINKFMSHDILFVDISLPDISGFEVIQTIRNCPEGRNLPIIALTVYNRKEEKIACLNAGANEFKSKPVSEIGLKKILLRHLTA